MPTYDFEGGTVPATFKNSPDYPWAIATDQKNGGTYSLKSGCAAVNRAFSQFTIIGDFAAGNVTFYRRYDTESGFDKFVFLIDGVVQTGYPKSGSGTTWTQDTFAISAGIHSLDWVYQKDANSNSGGDAVWIDDIVTPSFTDLTHTVETFDAGSLPPGWTNDPTQVWTFPATAGRRYLGTNIAKSASNFLSATSDLSYTVTTGAGKIIFYYRIESEAGFDFGKFYIDGAVQSSATDSGHYDSDLTGEHAGYRCRMYDVTAASHTFKWEYSEDSGTGGGDTCLYLDQFFYPPVAGGTNYSRTLSESTSITDSPARYASRYRGLLDSASVLDTLLRGISRRRLTLDAIDAFDNAKRHAVRTSTLSDSVVAGDVTKVIQLLFRSPVDAAQLNDATRRFFQAYRSPVDSVFVADSVTQTRALSRTLAEIAVWLPIFPMGLNAFTHDWVQQTVLAYRKITDKIDALDALTATLTLFGATIISRVIADSLNLADLVSRAAKAYRKTEEAAGIYDDAERSLKHLRFAQETLSLAESLSRAVLLARKSAESVSVVESAFRHALFARLVSEQASTDDELIATVSYFQTLLGFILMSLHEDDDIGIS